MKLKSEEFSVAVTKQFSGEISSKVNPKRKASTVTSTDVEICWENSREIRSRIEIADDEKLELENGEIKIQKTRF